MRIESACFILLEDKGGFGLVLVFVVLVVTTVVGSRDFEVAFKEFNKKNVFVLVY